MVWPVGACQAGRVLSVVDSREAFINALYNEHHRTLTRACQRQLGRVSNGGDLVDECVQDVFVQAYRSYDTLLEHPNVPGWLFRTLHNRVLSALRQRKRREKAIALHIDEKEADLPAPVDLLDQWMDREDTRQALERIIGTLTDKEKLIFDDYFLRDMKMRDIAGKQKTTIGAVKAIIFRIRAKAGRPKDVLFFLAFAYLCDLVRHYQG